MGFPELHESLGGTITSARCQSRARGNVCCTRCAD